MVAEELDRIEARSRDYERSEPDTQSGLGGWIPRNTPLLSLGENNNKNQIFTVYRASIWAFIFWQGVAELGYDKFIYIALIKK